jgi:hypothetical protein
MPSRLVFAIIFTLCLPSLLPAQIIRRGAQPGAQQGWQPTDLKGTIQDTGKGGLLVADNSNKTWRVSMVPNMTKLHVTGTLAASQLKTGMLAELTADFDEHGAVSQPIDGLAIISISADKRPGAFPAGGAVVGTGSDAGGKRPAGKAGARVLSGTYRIVGRLTIGHKDLLTIQAGPNKVQFTLAENAKINVDMADFSFVTRGSNVTVSGMALPTRPGFIQATEVNVVLSPVASDNNNGVDKKAAAAH